MRTGECRRRTLAYLLRAFHQIIKESVFVSRTGQQLLIVVEVIADSREYSLRYVIFADKNRMFTDLICGSRKTLVLLLP